MLTDTELSQIQSRCDAAQRGPWMAFLTTNKEILIYTHVETAVRISPELLRPEMRKRISEWDVQDEYENILPCPEAEISQEYQDTLQFVAHSRTDVAKLLAEIHELRAALSKKGS
jgi:hypothetical protein